MNHGTSYAYKILKCRCVACRTAAQLDDKTYRSTPNGKAYMKRYYQNRRLRIPEKIAAREAVSLAIKRGDLVRPNICEHCDASVFTEASHTDYANKLDIEWLCRSCHLVKDER